MEMLTPLSLPAVIHLSAGRRFLLGDLMRGDGSGFVKLNGSSVTLVGMGSGATLDAERRGRIFSMAAGNLTLTNLQLINGSAQVHGLGPSYKASLTVIRSANSACSSSLPGLYCTGDVGVMEL